MLILNEASLPFETKRECEDNIALFFTLLKQSIKEGVKIIRIDESSGKDWFTLNYANGFQLSTWIATLPNRDSQRFIKSIIDKTILRLFDENDERGNILKNSEFYLASDPRIAVPSLGAAYLHDKPAVSFCSNRIWLNSEIGLTQHRLTEDLANPIAVANRTAKNISKDNQLVLFLSTMKKERQDSKDYLATIKTAGNLYFPYIIFTDEALRGFIFSGADKTLFKQIIKALNWLNSRALTAACNADFVTDVDLTISGESTQTKNNSQLMRLRTFKVPSGGSIKFDLHIKNFTDNKRMYFFPNLIDKTVIVGYFGKHL